MNRAQPNRPIHRDVGSTRKAESAAAKRPRRRLSLAERRQQIVDAAIEYFAEVGFDGGMRALAKKIGVTQPLIYRYFPSKDDLIKEVYNQVYLDRWQAEWEDLLLDRRLPLRTRLVTFYKRYTETIFESGWLRIYLFSGLRGLSINQWWITFVEERILRRIAEEVRASYALPDPDTLPVQEAEIDLYWLFHGGVFYYGMRRHVYRAEPHLDLSRFIELGVDSLLQGMPQTVGRVLKEVEEVQPSPA